jgi:hypothetical protein
MFSWSHPQERETESIPNWDSLGEAERDAARCPAHTSIMQHTDLRCEKPRDHAGNHRATMHGSDVQLASDGHTVTATGWPVEWQDAEPAAAEAA